MVLSQIKPTANHASAPQTLTNQSRATIFLLFIWFRILIYLIFGNNLVLMILFDVGVDHQKAKRIIYYSVNISKYRDLYHLILPLNLDHKGRSKTVFKIARCVHQTVHFRLSFDWYALGLECGNARHWRLLYCHRLPQWVSSKEISNEIIIKGKFGMNSASVLELLKKCFHSPIFFTPNILLAVPFSYNSTKFGTAG